MTFYLSASCENKTRMNLCLAFGGPPDAIRLGLSDPEDAPALLVSFFYLNNFARLRGELNFRHWVMDSGAFSAMNSGKTICLKEYTETCKQMLKEDEKLTEVFSLDVIGDHKASAANCEYMWSQGVPAIPCFHIGEPESALMEMASNYPKIALGGVALLKGKAKMEWAEQCFARVWPKRIHGFGFGGESQMMKLPFDSVDATNWELGPCAFGRWNSFKNLSVRGGSQNLRAEVEHFLKLERKVTARWKSLWHKTHEENKL